jgi:dTDP-glucose 4,6-dehydratase
MTRSNRRVVVTGGAGFIGSHICQTLIESGSQVVCVDNMSTSTAGNLVSLQGRPGFEFIMADVTDGLEIVDGPVDAVMHLASRASPPDYLAHPLETLAAGAEGTRHALALATMHDARFVLASTSEIYGDPTQHPQNERYWGNVNPVGPRSVYDEAKRFAEALTMAWHRTRHTDVGVARIFNTYGPRMRPNDGRVVSNFVVQALNGRPLTVYGDGAQTRSFCFVDDMVAGLMALLDSSMTGPVNLGNPEERSVLELAKMVLEVTGASSEIKFGALPIDDPARRCPDIGLARQELGWEPLVQLRDGLRLTAAFFEACAAQGRTPHGGD